MNHSRVDIQLARRLAICGASHAVIARFFSVTRERIGQILGRRGSRRSASSDAVDRRIRKYMGRGWTHDQITAACRITEGTLHGIVRRLRIHADVERRKRERARKWLPMLRFYNTGHSASETALRYGISMQTVVTRLNRLEHFGYQVRRRKDIPIGQQTLQRMKEMRRAGWNQREIMKKLRLGDSQVRSLLRKSRCSTAYWARRGRRRVRRWLPMLRFYNAGHTACVTGRKYGISNKTIVQRLNRLETLGYAVRRRRPRRRPNRKETL